MNPTSTIRTDTVGVIATVVAPGALASAPYLWWLTNNSTKVHSLFDHGDTISVSLVLLIWVAAGFAVESLGSYIEVYCLDKNKLDPAKMLEEWWLYLRSAWTVEPVGQRYLRRLLVSFKFELNMETAILVLLPGVVLLCAYKEISRCTFATVVLVSLAAIALLHTVVGNTSDLLATVRHHLLKGVGQPPFNTNGTPKSNIEKILFRKATSNDVFQYHRRRN